MNRVFISSTFNDLKKYRSAVDDVIRRHFMVTMGMEYFGASTSQTLPECLSKINESDFVLCIVGVSYGTRTASNEPSYVEQEIDHAINTGKKLAAFFIDTAQEITVLVDHLAKGDDETALTALKRRISAICMPAYFSTPDQLAMRVSHFFANTFKDGYEELKRLQEGRRKYRECTYDLLAEWYDYWYKDHWSSTNIFDQIKKNIGERFPEILALPSEKVRILDCACGTGNALVAFYNAGYKNVIGTDGSAEMLSKARRNLERAKINPDRIVQTPINWTDDDYNERLNSLGYETEFDIVINTGNSFCHIPPIRDYMGLALSNFWKLLRSEGLLIIDTKKYIRDTPLKDDQGKLKRKPVHRELRFVVDEDATEGEWRLRSEREEKRTIPEKGGQIRFHTCMHYDTDESFGVELNRALIVLTVSGGNVTPTSFVIPYYPLPSVSLERFMNDALFTPTTIRAPEPRDSEYRYEMVIGRRRSS